VVVAISGLGQGVIDLITRTTEPFLVRVTKNTALNWMLIVIAFIAVLVFGQLIRVNRFSLHMLYANRLTRCYLGASRRKRAGSLGSPTGVPPTDPIRQMNLFTGFDPQDDFPLSDLRSVGGKSPYTGPVPLINCALNCLAGDELAYQDRRADAFVLTPEECGGRLTGFAQTPDKTENAGNLTLGRVMTISGAAVDPNMNRLSAPLTALMTIFNTRLGWWVENPRTGFRAEGSPWNATEPPFGWPLFWELIGLTNEDRDYVHLSDGGHFENLGVYELVRRRCRFIVVVDAGTDQLAASDNMAAMLMLVRTDFGIRIDLDPGLMQTKVGAGGYSQWHCAVGQIRYDEVDQASVPGVLIYIQATLTGDEPPDLLQYVARNPGFPRQSTLDQFFDEAQFECYRALGHHAATQVFGEAAAAWSGLILNPSDHRAETRAVFAALQEQWFPPPPCVESELHLAAKVTLELDQNLTNNDNLVGLSEAVYPELPLLSAIQPLTARQVQEFGIASEILQVMEISWSAMKLDGFRAHPINRGWMNTFRRWTSCESFHQFWPFLRAEYSKPFVNFCEKVLNLPSTRIEPMQAHLLLPEIDAAALVSELDKQFGLEWSSQLDNLGLPPRGFIADLRSKARNDSSGNPLLWFLFQKGKLNQYCCGIVCVADNPARLRILQPRSALIGQEAEFFVWLRGPYRAIGIGTEAVQAILEQIAADAPYVGPPAFQWLTAYYPLQSGGPGSRLELERWMNFFFDLGFRRVKQPDVGVGAKFAVLKCEL
jgi:hypothetical protein